MVNCADFSQHLGNAPILLQRRKIRLALVGTAALSLFAPLSHVSAAEPAADERIDEVTVTARRRAENLIDVPISVTAFTPERLERLAATSLKDLKNFVPSLHYSDRSALQTDITIRGVGGDSRNIGIDSGIGLYVDGVYAGRTSAYNLDLADIEQIEVLRGPQGTLFGKNTTGGALNITTQRPGRESRRSASLSVGNYGAVRLKGSVSGPLGETTAAKLTVATWDRDGYLDNLFDGKELQSEERRAIGAQLRFTPSDSWDVMLSLDYTTDDQRAILNQLGSNRAFGAGFFNPDRFKVNTAQRNSIERDMYGASLTLEHERASGLMVTSITAVRSVDITVFSDIDQTPNDVFRSGPFTDDARQVSQELRLTSPGGERVDWLVGLYAYKQDADASRRIFSNGNPLFITNGPVDTTSLAAFTNATWNATEQWALTAGLRITNEKKEGSYTQQSPVAPFNKNFPSLKISSTEPSWTLSANYKWSEDVSSYLSVSDGFKSGGFNVDPLATPAPLSAREITFEPEFVTSYELGTKARLLDGRLQLSGAVFFSQFEDRQVPQFETVGGTPTVITRNAGESEVKGIEAELAYEPTDQLSIFGGVSWLDGEYTDFRNATTAGANYTGNTTEKTPDLALNLGFEFRVPVGSGEFSISPQYAHVGKTYLQPDNGPFNQDDGYDLINLRAGYRSAEGRFGVYLWGKNLGNEEYKEFARQFSGSDQVLWGEPRTFGIEASVRF